MTKVKIWEAVKASLKADGIELHEKEKAIKSLSQCVAANLCISVYLEFTSGEKENDSKPTS